MTATRETLTIAPASTIDADKGDPSSTPNGHLDEPALETRFRARGSPAHWGITHCRGMSAYLIHDRSSDP